MRNLKKFLALILAFMMAFSLMVTVNAAAEDSNVKFGDEEQVEKSFVEDLEVIAGMGIIKGYSADEFGPTRTVTRAEMAAIVYRLATGDAGTGDYQDKSKLYADYGDFTDVAPTDWHAGYIGYCANAAIIVGYGDGTFGPNDPVTGHQALVMLLRAMGYNQPEEFTKADWRQKAASIATQRGLLDKVDETKYKGNLAANAAREVIAEITFQAAVKAQVQYTAAFGYQTFDTTSSAMGGRQRQSLGEANFYLAHANGIILGNEATGEKDDVTKIGFTGDPWFTTTTAQNTAASYYYLNTQGFSWETGLKDFGHEVDVWYRNNGTTHTTYAMFDRVEKVALTDKADLNNLDLTDKTTKGNTLYNAAVGEGFRVSPNAYWNYSFGRMYGPHYASNGAAIPVDNDGDGVDDFNLDYTSPILTTFDGTTSVAHPLYLLISNSSNKNLDLVVSLDMTITRVTQQDAVSSEPHTGVFAGNGATMGTVGQNYFGVATDKATGGSPLADHVVKLSKDNLIGTEDSAKTLGTRVAAIEITGTDGGAFGGQIGGADAGGNATPGAGGAFPTSTYYYNLSELKTVKKYTVTSVNVNTQAVTVSDGSVLERSPLALATDMDFMGYDRVNGPQVYGEYNFTLDENGKYIFWEPIVGTTRFVYGTYLDYQSGLGTSTYTYPLIGVGIDGQRTQDNVITYTKRVGTDPCDPEDPITKLNDGTGAAYNGSILPKRDSTGTNSVGSWKAGAYVGYLIDEKGNLIYLENGLDRDSVNTTGVYQADAGDFGSADVTIGSTDVALGVKQVGMVSGGKGLYLTQNTQFYIVDGAGTDTQKITPYKGLSELTKGLSSLKITTQGNATPTGYPYMDWTNLANAYEMIYYTRSPFTYAQDYDTSAFQVDTVIIPAACLSETATQSNSLVFVGNNAPSLRNTTGTLATQFTMYKDGVAGKYWIAGLVDTAGTDANIVNQIGWENTFYNLVDTGDKANDGQPVYELAAVGTTTADNLIGYYYDSTGTRTASKYAGSSATRFYTAATRNSQIALIDVDSANHAFNVGSAKVANLDETGYPGIKDLPSLNDASSLESNTGIPVSCIVSNNRIVSVIYVDYQP